MGIVEAIELTLSAVACVGLVMLWIEVRRTREAIRESDESQREHRTQMIEFAAKVLRTALDDGRARAVPTFSGNDNATAEAEGEQNADVGPRRPVEPSKE